MPRRAHPERTRAAHRRWEQTPCPHEASVKLPQPQTRQQMRVRMASGLRTPATRPREQKARAQRVQRNACLRDARRPRLSRPHQRQVRTRARSAPRQDGASARRRHRHAMTRNENPPEPSARAPRESTAARRRIDPACFQRWHHADRASPYDPPPLVRKERGTPTPTEHRRAAHGIGSTPRPSRASCSR